MAQDDYGDATNGFTIEKNVGSDVTIVAHGDLSQVFGSNEKYVFTGFGASENIKNGDSPVVAGEEWIPGGHYSIGGTEVTFTQMTKMSGWGTFALVLKDGSTDIWHELLTDLSSYNNTLIFKSSDESHPASVNNTVVHSLMDLSMRVLNLSGVYMDEITSPYYDYEANAPTTYNNNGTFCKANQYTQTPNTTIETLYTPLVPNGSVLYNHSFDLIKNLRYLHISDGVEVLEKDAISANGAPFMLSTITFPNTLKTIKSGAVAMHYSNSAPNKDLDGNEISYIQTLVFPASLEDIETGAFDGTCPKDVYFLGLEAPRVAKFAWGNNAYVSNNTLSLETAAIGTGSEKVTVRLDEGYAARDNYKSTNGYMCMLHYPAECTPAQAAKYTDTSRNYKRIDWNFEELLAEQEAGDSDAYVNYNPGQETSPLNGPLASSTGTGMDAPKSFGQEYNPKMYFNESTQRNEPLLDEDGNYDYVTEYGALGGNYVNGYFGGDYSGAYYDYALGSQYTWPSMGMAQRATIVAQNGVTWDGVTSIGDLIKNNGGSYEGDGSEFIGLHQFVFASGESLQKDTKKWNLDKYADGKWHSICVPFNMTKGDMKKTFGKKSVDAVGNPIYDIRLCEFSGVVRNADNITLQFNDEKFESATSDDDIVLKAHVSYMIWADADRTLTEHADFTDYAIVPGDPVVTKVMSHCTDDSDTPQGEYRFIGNYKTYSEDLGPQQEHVKMGIPQYSYYFSFSNQCFRFMKGDKNSPWNPYAAVVLVPEGQQDNLDYMGGLETPSNNAKLITSIMGSEDDATAIKNVSIEIDNNKNVADGIVYNLRGQKVGNSLEGLTKGIYIVNGKKCVVR
ncbi:MAG: leucine-rich repeat domain-containing protein [Bacteroidaceae bacterium]|nr:leucine-rich repeat domain-containing protein [Bacteroidaceae bacterium]